MPKTKTIHVSFILDETGSMWQAFSQTISGFNEYLATLKADKDARKTRFSLTQFNSSQTKVVYQDVPLDQVPDLTPETYRPYLNTPLYDAIGRTITALESSLPKGDKALVVIQTDGEENASKEYTRQIVFDMINRKQGDGWTFTFLGADQDAWEASAQLGISRGNTLSYDSQKTNSMFAATARATMSYARSGGQHTDSLLQDADTGDTTD